MINIFEDIFAQTPVDGIEAARRAMRPVRRHRFYRAAEAKPAAEGVQILLDGKPVRTPARNLLLVPGSALAALITAEWNAQQDVIDPATMPLTRLANAIIDGAVSNPRPVAEGVAQYLRSDLVFYRAEAPRGLVERQEWHWDPVIRWAREALGAHFTLAHGVMFIEQSAAALAMACAAIPDQPWQLGAVYSITTLTGSALLALMLARGQLSLDDAWAAAHVDEDWNMQSWGRDDEAMARRTARFAEFEAAAKLLSTLKTR